ncbi:unnamed protein product [Protopolystoma xenopodis]|uniref:Uncharacterized protein n=1 Tax=Protopolystoma xenopodis TaxID=117903 RepID=A0A3S5FE93_9PLAT|nr:unnamed protein product [Protopolystoma xenopodis]
MAFCAFAPNDAILLPFRVLESSKRKSLSRLHQRTVSFVGLAGFASFSSLAIQTLLPTVLPMQIGSTLVPISIGAWVAFRLAPIR